MPAQGRQVLRVHPGCVGRVSHGDSSFAATKRESRTHRATKTALATKRGRGPKKVILRSELLPLASRLWLTQAMPIAGVSRIAVVMKRNRTQSYRNRRNDARVEMQRTDNSHPSGAGTSDADSQPACVKRSLPHLNKKKGLLRGAGEVQAPPRIMTGGFCIYALHTKTKSTPKNAAEHELPHVHSRPTHRAVKHLLWTGDSA